MSESAHQLISALTTAIPTLSEPFASELATKFEELGDLSENVFVHNTDLLFTVEDGEDVPVTLLYEGVDALLEKIKVSEWKKNELQPIYEDNTEKVAQDTFDTISQVLNIKINVPDPVMRQVIKDGGLRIGLVDIESETRDAIFRALHEGRSAGEGYEQVARRIREYVPAGRFVNAGPKYRAKLIARTESKNAQRVSSLTAYEAAEDITHVQAVDGQLGDRSDQDCKNRNGNIYTFEEAKRENRSHITHPNCTLSWSPVVEPAEVAQSGDGVGSDITSLDSPEIAQARPQTAQEARELIGKVRRVAQPQIDKLTRKIGNDKYTDEQRMEWSVERAELIEERNQAYLSLLAHGEEVEGTDYSFAGDLLDRALEGGQRRRINDAVELFDDLVLAEWGEDADVVFDVEGVFRPWAERRLDEDFGDTKIVIFPQYSGQSVVIHEMIHALEASNQDLFQATVDYLYERTRGATLQTIAELTGNEGYADFEVGYDGGFMNAYAGRWYSVTQEEYDATPAFRAGTVVDDPHNTGSVVWASEMAAMGMQWIVEDAGALAQQDPGLFDHMFTHYLRGE